MMNPKRVKRRSLIYLGLAIGALFLLAAGLSSITFEGAPPLTLRPLVIDESGGVVDRTITQRLQLIFYLFMFLYVMAVISIFLSREGRFRLIAFILMLAVVVLCVYAVGSLMRGDEPPAQVAPTPTGEALPPEVVAEPTLETIPVEDMPLPSTPSWLVTLVGVTISAALAGAVLALLWLILRPRRTYSLPQALAEEAQEAVDALEAGGDLSNVIIRCYAQMSKVLYDERSLIRQAATTPREFEQVLLRVGLPAEPVHILTHLFEEARYGGIAPDTGGVEQALSSLRAIVAHCEALKAAEKDAV